MDPNAALVVASARARRSTNTASKPATKGIITMKTGDKTGGMIGALIVRGTDEIMLITVAGQMVRTFVREIREAGRNTMGVKLVDLDPDDKLQGLAPVISEQQEDATADAPGGK